MDPPADTYSYIHECLWTCFYSQTVLNKTIARTQNKEHDSNNVSFPIVHAVGTLGFISMHFFSLPPWPHELPSQLTKMVPVTFRCLIFLCKGYGDILSNQHKSNIRPSFPPQHNMKCITQSPFRQSVSYEEGSVLVCTLYLPATCRHSREWPIHTPIYQ